MLCKVLSACERRGLVLGDLKPGNVVFDGRLQAYLIDVEGSRLLDGVCTTVYPTIYSKQYAAPEVLREEDAEMSHKSDLYSLGCILKEFATAMETSLSKTVSCPCLHWHVVQLATNQPRARYCSLVLE